MAECVEMEGFIDVSQMLRGGVYMLLHQGTVVYVGKAKVMLGRIYTHRVAWGSRKRTPRTATQSAKGMLFDQVLIRPCLTVDIDALEAELIALHRPRYNIRLKSSVPPELGDLVARICASRGMPTPAPSRIERRGF